MATLSNGDTTLSPLGDAPLLDIPLGNLEPRTLARFIFNDFAVAWDAMATCSREPTVGGNFMFARQAFAYLELASRTASTDEHNWYLGHFARRLESCDRYFTELPCTVSTGERDFRLPTRSTCPADRQLLAALFDTARHGLSHLGQQIPVRLTDDKIWMLSFTGVRPGELFEERPSAKRRERHLAFTISSKGHVYLVVRPDILIADLHWSARLAAIFSQYLTPKYLERPRPRSPRSAGSSRPRARRTEPSPYRFSSSELTESLRAAGHPEFEWPATAA